MGLQLFSTVFPWRDCCEVFENLYIDIALSQRIGRDFIGATTNQLNLVLADVEKLQKSNREFDTVSCNPINSSIKS